MADESQLGVSIKRGSYGELQKREELSGMGRWKRAWKQSAVGHGRDERSRLRREKGAEFIMSHWDLVGGDSRRALGVLALQDG